MKWILKIIYWEVFRKENSIYQIDLPVDIKRTGDRCEKCRRLRSVVGQITDYTDPHDGYRALLCSDCIQFHEKPYKSICPKCKRLAHKHGGMSFYGEPSYHHEVMCFECVKKKEKKVKKQNTKKLKIKNLLRKNWKFWIMLTVAVIILLYVHWNL